VFCEVPENLQFGRRRMQSRYKQMRKEMSYGVFSMSDTHAFSNSSSMVGAAFCRNRKGNCIHSRVTREMSMEV